MGGRRFAQLVSNSLSMPMQVPISAASNTFMICSGAFVALSITSLRQGREIRGEIRSAGVDRCGRHMVARCRASE